MVAIAPVLSPILIVAKRVVVQNEKKVIKVIVESMKDVV